MLSAVILSVKTIWSTRMCPQPPLCASTISIRAVLPRCRDTSRTTGRSVSLLSPVADATVLPSITMFTHVSPGCLPPPISSRTARRSTLKGLEVSLPLGASLSCARASVLPAFQNESARPLPTYPRSGWWW